MIMNQLADLNRLADTVQLSDKFSYLTLNCNLKEILLTCCSCYTSSCEQTIKFI